MSQSNIDNLLKQFAALKESSAQVSICLISEDSEKCESQLMPLCSQLSLNIAQVANVLSIYKGRDAAREQKCSYDSPSMYSSTPFHLYPGTKIPGIGFAPTTEQELIAGALLGYLPLMEDLALGDDERWDFETLMLVLVALWDPSHITNVTWIDVPENADEQHSLVRDFLQSTQNLMATVETTLDNLWKIDHPASLEVLSLMRNWISDWEAEINA